MVLAPKHQKTSACVRTGKMRITHRIASIKCWLVSTVLHLSADTHLSNQCAALSMHACFKVPNVTIRARKLECYRLGGSDSYFFEKRKDRPDQRVKRERSKNRLS